MSQPSPSPHHQRLILLLGFGLSIIAALVISLLAMQLLNQAPAATPVIPTIASLPSASPTLPPTATQTPTVTPSLTATATHTPTLTPTFTPTPIPPALADFWAGYAHWVLDIANVGLPLGESDTINWNDTVLWSFLHASGQSNNVIDQCGNPAPFPGCITLWSSEDGGQWFNLAAPICLIPCESCPCDADRDHPQQQQYPRMALVDDGTLYMVYEWGARTMLRTSTDNGLTWSSAAHIPRTGVWPQWLQSCTALEHIDAHPFVPALDWDCLVGAPPGIFIDGDELYVFVDIGSSPAHMGCLHGSRFDGAAGLTRCTTDPLFSGAATYGPLETAGAAANPYFDFRYVSSADVVQEGGRFYMVYEGVRGPGPGDPGDTQFGLGFARSSGPAIDIPWEKYPGNPIIRDLPGDVGVGHADLVQISGAWYLYTTTSAEIRGRYRLDWR